jgi:hypothetical protein
VELFFLQTCDEATKIGAVTIGDLQACDPLGQGPQIDAAAALKRKLENANVTLVRALFARRNLFSTSLTMLFELLQVEYAPVNYAFRFGGSVTALRARARARARAKPKIDYPLRPLNSRVWSPLSINC